MLGYEWNKIEVCFDMIILSLCSPDKASVRTYNKDKMNVNLKRVVYEEQNGW